MALPTIPSEDRAELPEHIRPAYEALRGHQRQLDMDGCEVGVSRQALDEVLAFAASLRSAAPVAAVPEGYNLVPIEPPIGLLMSIAIRLDHALAVPGYYDQPMFSASGVTHARRVEVAISDARKAWEEMSGAGFYKPDREARYAALASSQAADPAGGEGW